MASIISVPTLAQIEGITRRDFFKSFLLDSGLGKYGTATSGSTTVIGDTARLKSTQYDTKDYVVDGQGSHMMLLVLVRPQKGRLVQSLPMLLHMPQIILPLTQH